MLVIGAPKIYFTTVIYNLRMSIEHWILNPHRKKNTFGKCVVSHNNIKQNRICGDHPTKIKTNRQQNFNYYFVPDIIFFLNVVGLLVKKIKQHTLSYVMYVYLSGTLKTTTNGREKIQKFSDFFIQHLYFMCQRYTFFYTQ